jgi:hypothetical protein
VSIAHEVLNTFRLNLVQNDLYDFFFSFNWGKAPPVLSVLWGGKPNPFYCALVLVVIFFLFLFCLQKMGEKDSNLDSLHKRDRIILVNYKILNNIILLYCS